MTRPIKLSANVFLELPPILSRYVETERNLWLTGAPAAGSVSLLDRPGVFHDLEALAVERRHLVQVLGFSRARALSFRTAFEQGRRDAVRHREAFDGNLRLALQAAPVFTQLQGKYLAELVRFEFDLEAGTLYRELLLRSCAERAAHRISGGDGADAGCWCVCGYLSGHASELLGARVLTLAPLEYAVGQNGCRLIGRFDAEWGADADADWCRAALLMETVEDELAALRCQVAEAEARARDAEQQAGRLVAQYAPALTEEAFSASSGVMSRTLERARQASACDVPLLLWGEDGAGKKTLARAIHAASARREARFVTLDCQAFSQPEAFLSALCGEGDRLGAVHHAHGGTLYLGGLSGMSPEGQAALADLLEQAPLEDAGASRPDVRIMAAIEEDPETAVREKRLRKDLYFRLNVLPLHVPPLREREGDILALAARLLADLCKRHGRPNAALERDVKEVFLEGAWPGNLLQLRQALEHALLLGSDGRIALNDLPEEVVTARRASTPRELSEEVVRAVLRRTNGNRSEAARLLGVGRTSLWRSMRRLGIGGD